MTMNAFRLAVWLLGLLVALPATAAPKNILLSDSLLANADKWDVKHGAYWMGKFHWSFGDYVVLSSKSSGTHSKTKTNLLETKSESRAANTFEFVLGNKTMDSAFVHATHEITARSNPGLKLGDGWTAGGEEGTHGADLFTASITLNGDSTAAWALSIGSTDVANREGDSMTGGTHSATLKHGDREIVLASVFSEKITKRPSIGSLFKMHIIPPAMGYEFAEEGHSLCAVEYSSSGLAGSAKNTVWMDRNADSRLRLVLAAAITAILELQSAVAQAPAEPE